MSAVSIASEERIGSRCLGCHMPTVELVLDLGPQPPSNLFLKSREQSYPMHPLRFGVCAACGLAQLIEPMPENLVRCTHDWLRYEEPEQHLDDLAAYLYSFIKKDGAVVGGASYKDITLLERLKNRGWKVNVSSVKTVEDSFHLADRVDVLIARHILEHARNPGQFVEACASRCSPEGLLVFEVPSFERMLHDHLHCFLWEEHILYFTRASLENFLNSCGLEVLDVLSYPLALENSLVALARPARSDSPRFFPARESVEDTLERTRAFGVSLPRCREQIQTELKWLMRKNRVLSMFGAGHLGIKFIHFYGLAPFLETALDDHPQKIGTFLPASLLPIKASSWLARHMEGVCLVAINPENHKTLIKRHPFFAPGVGEWRSIFTDLSSC